jgi:serine O-acetyltransferase
MAFSISDLGKMHQSEPSFYLCFKKSQQYLKTPLLNIFWKLVLRHYQIKYGFQIYPETEIGEGFYLGHWGSLVINPKLKSEKL